MSLTKIDVAAAGVYYLEAGEVHGDIVSPVHGDLAIYTYAPAGGFLGQEYSFATTTGWFERAQISEVSDGSAATQALNLPSAKYSGTQKVYLLDVSVSGSAPNGTAEIYDNATGLKAFNVSYDQTVQLAAGEMIVVGHSVTASDVDVLTNIQSFITEANGTRTGLAYFNIVILTTDFPTATIIYDGTNTIKRISAMTDAASDQKITLTSVE